MKQTHLLEGFSVFHSPVFQNKYKLSKHPSRQRIFDRIFVDWLTRGEKKRTAAAYCREHGTALDCDKKTLGRWLVEGEKVYYDWREVPAPLKNKKRKRTKYAEAKDKELADTLMAEMSLEVAHNIEVLLIKILIIICRIHKYNLIHMNYYEGTVCQNWKQNFER